MLAKDVMTRNVITVRTDTPVPEIARIMAENQISGLPVLDENDCLVGMVSEDDLLLRYEEMRVPHRLALFGFWVVPEEALLKAYEHRSKNARARDVMSRDVVTFQEDDDVKAIAQAMVRRQINRVPIVRDCKLVGIVSRADIVKAMAGT